MVKSSIHTIIILLTDNNVKIISIHVSGRVKKYIQMREDYVCGYCCKALNENKLPAPCVLNWLEPIPIPEELANLDQLIIQRVEAFKTIVHLGTYSCL